MELPKRTLRWLDYIDAVVAGEVRRVPTTMAIWHDYEGMKRVVY